MLETRRLFQPIWNTVARYTDICASYRVVNIQKLTNVSDKLISCCDIVTFYRVATRYLRVYGSSVPAILCGDEAQTQH